MIEVVFWLRIRICNVCEAKKHRDCTSGINGLFTDKIINHQKVTESGARNICCVINIVAVTNLSIKE